MPYLALSRINIDTAYKYRYVREQKSNRSFEIDLWNKFVGNALGSPYCAAFVSYCNNQDSIIPFKIKSGLARTFWSKSPTKLKHTAKNVLNNNYKPKYGDLIIWANGATMTGHIGFVLSSNEKTKMIITIEANTSSGNSGSQSDGDGVFIRLRKIYLYQYFHIIGFVETK